MMVDGSEDQDPTGTPDRSEDEEVDDVEIESENLDQVGEMGEEDDYVDMSTCTFSQHTGAVFCVDISKSERYVLSGGEDDSAYIWEVQSPDEKFQKVEGHKDSLSHVGFSYDDKYYFTADMAGYIQLFETETHRKLWDFDLGVDITFAMWHKVVPILIAGANDGAIWMWKVPSFETKTIQLSSSPPVDAKFLSTNRHLVVGYQDGFVKVVDLKSGEATMSVEIKRVITSIAASRDDSIIMVGTLVGSLYMLATKSGKIVSTLTDIPPTAGNPNETPPKDSIENIEFHPTRTLVAASYVNDRVNLWDTALQRVRTCLKHPHGVIKSDWAGDLEQHLVTACLDGNVRVWDVDQNTVVAEATGHTDQLLDMKISRNLIVTSSNDGTVKVFSLA